MDNVVIEQLVVDDWQRFRTLRLQALQDAPDAFGATYAEAAERTEDGWRYQINTLPTFVATTGQGDVGMVRAGPDDDDPQVVWLLSMWVSPTHRAKGVGLILIEAVVSWAQIQNAKRILLDVADNNESAIALYAKAGFVPTGVTGSLPAPRQHILEHQQALELTA